MKFVPRRASTDLRAALRTFPAVLVLGPRQCGKSTLVRKAAGRRRVFDLERPEHLAALRADPTGLIEAADGGLVVDEAQLFPEIFSILRPVLDASRRKGRVVLTGSASPVLVRGVAESLAGRVGILELTPFRGVEVPAARRGEMRWFWGGYPPVHALRTDAARVAWLDAYVTTFLERDLPALGINLPSERIRRLWMMLTHVHGGVLTTADLARSLGVSAPTVERALDVLEGTFMIRRLPPHFANVRKRLTKSPKVYVRDTGLLHFLAGLRSPKDLETWPRRGQSFEGLVLEELVALAKERVVRPHVAYWRTQAGAEVDLLLGDGRRLLPIEIKLGASVDQYAFAGIRNCMKDLDLDRGWIVCRTPERVDVGRGVELIPWDDVLAGRVEIPLG